jgi:hypothetical protein
MKTSRTRDVGQSVGDANDARPCPGKHTLVPTFASGPVQRKAIGGACPACRGAVDAEAPCPTCRSATGDAAAQAGRAPAPDAPGLGGGRALGHAERAPFERSFATSFEDVRVHDGGAADQSARSLDALAYTRGTDIVFGAGQLNPGAAHGQRLLAHELAHVVQQRAHRPSLAAFTTPQVSAPHDAAEHEADRAADDFMAGRPIAPLTAAPAGIARTPLPSVATDWEIHRPGTTRSIPAGAPQRVFFDRNQDAVAAADPAIAATALPADADLQVVGYASADELTADPTIVQRRVDHATAALVAAGHLPAHISTTLRPSPQRADYRRVRSVEILRPGEASVEPVAGAPATQACDAATETAYQDAKDHAINDFLDPVISALATVTPGTPLAAALTRFFHGPTNAGTVAFNLTQIRAEVSLLGGAANHRCATMNDSSCAGGAIAYNDPSAHRMTICPGYVPVGGAISGALRDDHARNLIHEAAHSTAGLRGVPRASSGGTSDFGYRHQRMIDHLPLTQELANSDSYALFVLTVQGGTISAAPPVDTAGAGFSLPADQAQFDRAEVPLARIENWIRRAQQWIAQTHGVARTLIDLAPGPARTWTGRFSTGATFARQSGFDVQAPPALPAADDDVKYAAINDRLRALAQLLANPIEISRDTTPGAHMHFVAGPPVALVVNPVFLTNGPDVRANMMLERLVDLMAAAEISPPLRPAYAELVRRVRQAEGA